MSKFDAACGYLKRIARARIPAHNRIKLSSSAMSSYEKCIKNVLAGKRIATPKIETSKTRRLLFKNVRKRFYRPVTILSSFCNIEN